MHGRLAGRGSPLQAGRLHHAVHQRRQGRRWGMAARARAELRPALRPPCIVGRRRGLLGSKAAQGGRRGGAGHRADGRAG
eukprot:327942-Alexandrium_andersonii.AAC.1